MQPTEQDFEKVTLAAAESKRWHFGKDERGNTLWLSEGSLALAFVKAGYAMATQTAQPAPLADAEVAELEALVQSARTAFAAWEGDPESIYLLDASDTSDMELGRAAAEYLPGLLARVRQAEASKWVAVSEGLPLDNGSEDADPFGTTLVLVARPQAPYVLPIAVGYLQNGEWYITREQSDEDDFIDDFVTHWQPLPLAPAPVVKGGQPHA